MPPRLTRKEKQAHTRTCLMHSAAKLFARQGLERASIEDVAEDAGFTKGAFYANFKNKEELFLAMLDERFAERIDEFDKAILGEGSAEDRAHQAGADFTRYLVADPEWQRLFFEFSAYAARNEDFREELVTRYHALRGRIAAAFQQRFDEAGVEPPIPVDRLSLMMCAMANGFALEKLLEGEAIPDDIYGSMLAVFFAGFGTLVPTQA